MITFPSFFATNALSFHSTISGLSNEYETLLFDAFEGVIIALRDLSSPRDNAYIGFSKYTESIGTNTITLHEADIALSREDT